MPRISYGENCDLPSTVHSIGLINMKNFIGYLCIPRIVTFGESAYAVLQGLREMVYSCGLNLKIFQAEVV